MKYNKNIQNKVFQEKISKKPLKLEVVGIFPPILKKYKNR